MNGLVDEIMAYADLKDTAGSADLKDAAGFADNPAAHKSLDALRAEIISHVTTYNLFNQTLPNCEIESMKILQNKYEELESNVNEVVSFEMFTFLHLFDRYTNHEKECLRKSKSTPPHPATEGVFMWDFQCNAIRGDVILGNGREVPTAFFEACLKKYTSSTLTNKAFAYHPLGRFAHQRPGAKTKEFYLFPLVTKKNENYTLHETYLINRNFFTTIEWSDIAYLHIPESLRNQFLQAEQICMMNCSTTRPHSHLYHSFTHVSFSFFVRHEDSISEGVYGLEDEFFEHRGLKSCKSSSTNVAYDATPMLVCPYKHSPAAVCDNCSKTREDRVAFSCICESSRPLVPKTNTTYRIPRVISNDGQFF